MCFKYNRRSVLTLEALKILCAYANGLKRKVDLRTITSLTSSQALGADQPSTHSPSIEFPFSGFCQGCHDSLHRDSKKAITKDAPE